MSLCIISRKQAEYVGMSASVAGGWVMIPGEWANRVHLMDSLSRLAGNEHQSWFLAKLPDLWDMGYTVSPKQIHDIIAKDIAFTEKRTWAKSTIADDLEILRHWQKRVCEI